MVLQIFSSLDRPDASTFAAGTAIWNSSEKAPNWSDGKGNWRDALGNLT